MRKSVPLFALMALAVLLAIGVAMIVAVAPARAAFPGANGKIVFAEVNYWNENNNGIRLINPSGTALSTPLASPIGRANPAFSPNGTRISYASLSGGFSDSRSEIYKINISNRRATQLTRNQ